MAKLVELEPVKTYKTRENAIKAVEKKDIPEEYQGKPLRYIVIEHTDGRFFPVFLGTVAVEAGLHFHFNILG